jgi:hypothetical protein
MDALASFVTALFAAIIGALLGIKYSSLISNRQEKAILVLLLQEFTMLLSRTTTYYEQSLNGNVSFSTLFEVSDSSTFTKLAELEKNSEIIKTALKLKADFFQVVRYANKASECIAQKKMAEVSGNDELAKRKKEEASFAQAIALIFFLGDVYDNKVGFARNRYKTYIGNISLILYYLQELNTPPKFESFMLNLIPPFRNEIRSADEFIAEYRKQLEGQKEKLDLLREKEKLLRHST